MDDADRSDERPRNLREQFKSDPWPVVGFTTAEHNNLTSRRGTLTSETTGRVTAYLSTLSAALVSLGFVGAGSGGHFGDAFFGFGAIALGIAVVVGIVTFFRCLQGSVEDVVLGERIERLRRVYLDLVPGLADHLDAPMETSLDDARRASGMTGPSGWQLALTMAGLVTMVNSALIGVVVGFVLRLAGARVAIVWSVACLAALLSSAIQFRAQQHAFAVAERAGRQSSRDG